MLDTRITGCLDKMQLYIHMQIFRLSHLAKMNTSVGILIFRNHNFYLFKIIVLQLNEYKTDQYFLQNFQCTTMLIYAFCKIWERGIVFVSMFLVFIMVMFRAISASQILQKNHYILKYYCHF